ncbi:MAG: hypothetical protein Q4P08_06265 [Eubacteriales bacterium]|nr:hypothetical protein [Eubacteriales bacterium]
MDTNKIAEQTTGNANEAEQNVNKTEQGDGGQDAGLNLDEASRIASERSERAQRSALKSYFKQQGLSEAEAQQAFEDFKASKAQKEEERNNLTALQQKLAGYKKSESEMLQKANKRLIRSEAMVQAAKLAVRPDRIDYAIRLADISQVEVDEQGNVDGTAVQEALKKVTEDLPEILNQAGKEDENDNRPGFKMGGPGQSGAEGIPEKIAGIFGNKT